MCGIAGLVSRSTHTAALGAAAQAMADALRHRGPDDSGVWVEPKGALALAHTRLSILDLSPAGHQPMSSITGRYTVVFNGEMYNFLAIRRDLEQRGYSFRGHSDTEVLLAAFERWGVRQAVSHFNGMFALAVFDRDERTITLARDRLGEKPLYYGRAGNDFAFASELKAITAITGNALAVDPDALALYFRHNYVPAPYSIYRGIYKLLPGALLTVDVDRPTWDAAAVDRYWDLREIAEAGASLRLELSDGEFADAVEAILLDSVDMRMVSDVPVGAFLSGGIDSSLVVALMQAGGHHVRTFTIGFEEQGFDEAVFARDVAQHLGTDHTELYVTPTEAMAVIPRLPMVYDEPFSDSSQIPTYLVSELARRHVTVALSGDGGDELFGGYTRYAFHRSLWRRFERVPAPLRRAAAKVISAPSAPAWDRLSRLARPLLPQRARQEHVGEKLHKLASVIADASAESVYLTLVSHFTDPAALVLGAVEPPTPLTSPDGWPRLDDFTERMMYLDSVTYLPDDILVKVDRAAMAHSLETRVPMLDHRLVELAWTLPIEQKMRSGVGKHVLRSVLHRHVPKELVERPKMGFGVPIGEWLRGPLREWGEDLLSPALLRDSGLDVERVRALWSAHSAGQADWKYHLWDVLMFQSWREHATSTAAAAGGD